ncbi:PQQ-dependent methanol/ethanol family dehydrogenase [Pseudosulfitobacter pseudonitzschiae]|uniref:PQQ-dependent methanol/ethanol family dehydrogenase n=1 Tax=Pseudosulfitobacter pseudonitzschiae TaxID=1402135 RepID=UPI001AF36C12|nr:PQQ-dependent methanol/ethanol family dehydrogenase [Pseudosulfitobacter pseudonitzschiae]MBM1817279.1 PQQ-dependent methanol/ethanol family dehydrogenase [Pseudosulfitobacter pseudonitzschiae]MBM1834290.1 PQQ-dependent methanol/ethanol family dehydrogenase [Pseudosulfitobacter pseudonitzschiae]MBM1839155.1 PQQ-dependent methanol/ethanol family dehydrogenase [Pseudosulfitobacter pseudonitzschiae]MBM1844004.1 PQQ-dependent methanol/ethanol family dehydrogenase [Pseudosulfitobacter pseudonitzs
MNKFIIAAVAGLLATSALAEGHASGVTEEMLANDTASTQDVLTNGMGRHLQRYSPLDTLNRDNVKNLVPAWAFSLGGEKQRGQETQPLVHDGIMYITGSYSRLYAIDVKTGEELWQYDARLPEGILPCCDVVNRGAALYGENIYFGTLDARIVALNAKTGDTVWNKKIADYKAGYSYTAAPLIVNGLVVTGNSGGEFGIVGSVQARDAETGELAWERPVIEGHMGTLNGEESTMTGTLNATWPGDMWKTGGGATWLGGSYDADTDTLVFGTGNPAPWNSWLRDAGQKNDGTGDNLYAASRLGIDPATGEIKWHFQTTPREGWDYDGVNEVVAYTDREGNQRYATADRNGYFYVLNREDGAFVSATPFVKDISWASGIDENGRPIYNEEGRPGDPSSAADGKKGEVVFASPSFLGGKNWMPMAHSPDTGLFYVPSNEWGMDIWNEPITYKKGAAYLGSGFTIKPNYEDHIGSLKAIDPDTGETKWEYKNDAPLWGGVMATAGGLVFTGTPEGKFIAFDDETGEELWSFQTGSGIVGQPITWEQDGEQYVTVISGWGGAVPLWGGEVAKKVNYLNQGGTLWTFRLPAQLASSN